MNKFKLFLVSAFVLTAITLAPVMSMAKEDNEKENSNSIWNRLMRVLEEENEDNVSQESEDNQAPIISGITAPTLLHIGEVGTWKINASDPENGALTYAVNWGEIRAKNLFRSAKSDFTQDTTFTHSYAHAGKYNIVFSVKDDKGLETTSSVTVKVIGPAVQSLTISNLKITDIKDDSATISWSTNLRSSSYVWFDTSSPVDSSAIPDIVRNSRVFKHKIELEDLDPNTKYYLVAGSSANNGLNGGLVLSDEISFTTLGITNNGAPVITNLSGKTEVKVGETETVTVEAYDPENGALAYAVDWGDISSMKALEDSMTFVQTATFSHIYNSPGTYKATFIVKDEQGLKDSETIKITVKPIVGDDTTAPVISGIGAEVGTSTAKISWTTDESSTSKVYYSISTPINIDSDSVSSVYSKVLKTSHSMNIYGLAPNTKFYFIVASTDAAGNTAISAESSFTTSSGS